MDAPPDTKTLPAICAYRRCSSNVACMCRMCMPPILHRVSPCWRIWAPPTCSRRCNSGARPRTCTAHALDTLAHLQLRGDAASRQLPPYDRATLLREMQLLPDWYCRHHLQFEPDAGRAAVAAARPSSCWSPKRWRSREVFVHRDYHSRNLMVTGDALAGCHRFPGRAARPGWLRPRIHPEGLLRATGRAPQVEAWVAGYRDRLLAGGAAGRALAGASMAQFLRWFDFIGLQRHIKVLGIFARLCWRDGKTGYLADLPRTLAYVQEVAHAYPELARFRRFRGSAAGARACCRQCARAGCGARHESDAACGRARRTHAAADRYLPEAVAAGGRQAADRLASGAAGAGRHPRRGDQSVLAGRDDRRRAG